jgi:hypothetical protein
MNTRNKLHYWFSLFSSNPTRTHNRWFVEDVRLLPGTIVLQTGNIYIAYTRTPRGGTKNFYTREKC